MTTARARGRRFLIIGGLATCALAVLLAILYAVRNLEHAPLDDAARRGAPGSFVRLADGVTHYELIRPDTARTVVLLSGMSVPYYLWDPTGDALAGAGYRVLRYDYYGRASPTGQMLSMISTPMIGSSMSSSTHSEFAAR